MDFGALITNAPGVAKSASFSPWWKKGELNFGVNAGPTSFIPFSDNFRENGLSLMNIQQPEFATSAREWLRDIREKMMDIPPVLSDFTTFAEAGRSNFEQRRRLLENFFLDMSKVSFDPEKDWGFHIGPWYFIRRDGDDLMSSVWTLLRPRNPPPPSSSSDADSHEFDFDNEKTYPSTIFNTIAPEITSAKPQASTEKTSVKDNETVDQSAEVIAPN